MGWSVLVTLTAHCTPILMSCNGTWEHLCGHLNKTIHCHSCKMRNGSTSLSNCASQNQLQHYSQHSLICRVFVQLWICMAWNESILWLQVYLTSIHFPAVTILKIFVTLLVIVWCFCWKNTSCFIHKFSETNNLLFKICSSVNILWILKEL
jgi:hypothetical protein